MENDNVSNNIAKVIKDIRKKNKMTQLQFAEILKVTPQAVSKWEHAINIPDIAILKQISTEFNIDLNYLLGSENHLEKEKKTKLKYILVIFLIFSLIVFSIFLYNSKNEMELRSFLTNASDFEVNGCVVFNDELSSIIVSDIKYHGSNDEKIYKKVNFTLYEENDGKLIKIEEQNYNNSEKKLLKDLILDVKINVTNYEASCKTFESNKLYIKIEAVDNDNKIKTYEIPFEFADDCSCSVKNNSTIS